MSRIYTSDFRNTKIEIFIICFNVKMGEKQWVCGLESSCFLSEVAVRLQQRHDPRLA